MRGDADGGRTPSRTWRVRAARARLGDRDARVQHVARGRGACCSARRALAAEEVERCRAFGAAGPLGRGAAHARDARSATKRCSRRPSPSSRPSAARLEHALAPAGARAAPRARPGGRHDARAPLREALDRPATAAPTPSSHEAHRRARRGRRPTATRSGRAPHQADGGGAARRPPGGRGPQQPRDRAGAVPDREHRPDAPPQRLPQARHRLALPTRAGALKLTGNLTDGGGFGHAPTPSLRT